MKKLLIVLAFAGDSTITNFIALPTGLFYESHFVARLPDDFSAELQFQKLQGNRCRIQPAGSDNLVHIYPTMVKIVNNFCFFSFLWAQIGF